MSRQNKVNPGMYTQRGRLTQDDAARELKRQRSIGSQHTWQPVQKDAMPRLAPKQPIVGGAETSEDNDNMAAAPATAKQRPAPRVTKKASPKAAPSVKAKAAKSKSGKTKTATTKRKVSGKAKAGRAAKPAAKAQATTGKRKAVLARNVGGGGSKPRQTAKRRKS